MSHYKHARGTARHDEIGEATYFKGRTSHWHQSVQSSIVYRQHVQGKLNQGRYHQEKALQSLLY